MSRQLRAPALTPFVRQRLTMFIAEQRSSDFEPLTGLIEAGKVTPSIDRTYALAEAPDARRHLGVRKERVTVAITI